MWQNMKKKFISLMVTCLLFTRLYGYDDCLGHPGSCYTDCRETACLVTSILVGTAVIVGLVAIVISESHCSHSSH